MAQRAQRPNAAPSQGDSGAAVAKMQSELSQAGLLVPASGVFDEATKKRWKFQNTYHIQATGEAGPPDQQTDWKK